MKPMDHDVWKDISSLSPLHHPTTTHHFQDFFAPAATPGLHSPSPQSRPPLVTMLSLSTSDDSGHDQEPPHNIITNSTTGVTSLNVASVIKQTSPLEYTEKFKRLMKNRESAARSRARKQARADELEREVIRLKKENAKLKRLEKELCSVSTTQVLKKPRLHRSNSAPL